MSQKQNTHRTSITADDFPDNLDNAAACILACLDEGTGLSEFEQKLIAYYCIATHSVPHMDSFPLLVFKGPQGTGKSSALKVVCKVARAPKSISLRNSTQAAVRDELAGCYQGTAIIEEGDSGWKDAGVEPLLSDRCQRTTAVSTHNKPGGDGGWIPHRQDYFGATAIHRRMPFSDAALQSRSISVRFRRNDKKKYPGLQWQPSAALVEYACGILKGVDSSLPQVDTLESIDARIRDTYSPVLAVARILGDDTFLNNITGRLHTETLTLREGQAAEPEPLVLNALLSCLWNESKKRLDFGRRVAYSDIAKSIEVREHVILKPHQIGSMLRDLGFSTTTSHGVTKVDLAPGSLIAACEQFGIEDEALSKQKAEMLKG